MTPEMLVYKRARFGTRLPLDRIYTRSHYWLREVESGLWQAGFTKFASRMLGDIVEYQFEATPENEIEVGQKIGWIEGFKALSEIYSAADGTFQGANPELQEDITLLESDPYHRGWLYQRALFVGQYLLLEAIPARRLPASARDWSHVQYSGSSTGRGATSGSRFVVAVTVAA